MRLLNSNPCAPTLAYVHVQFPLPAQFGQLGEIRKQARTDAVVHVRLQAVGVNLNGGKLGVGDVRCSLPHRPGFETICRGRCKPEKRLLKGLVRDLYRPWKG